MSHARHEATKLPNAGFSAGDDSYPPRSAQNHAWQGESDFVDGSGPIFSMYLEMAEEEDRKMVESWKADAEGILVFTGLFSAAVASLISVSIQDIRQNPQDTSNFYLANIYQAIADPNRSNISTSLPASPPPFSPPGFAVWVNGLWFMSLVISITGAVLATLLQQWARRYLKVTQTRYTLHKRARIRTFFAEGVEKSFLPQVVEALPTLIHVSLVLFFAGLAVFLWNVNLTIFKAVLSWISVCTALYGCITLIPIFRRDSPYYTPLTLFAWLVIVVMLGAILIFCVGLYMLASLIFSCCCVRSLRIFGYLTTYVDELLGGAFTTPEEVALESPPELDTRALMWTFGRLDEDHELARFFSGLPAFHSSNVVKEPLRGLDKWKKLKLLTTMVGFLDRTSSSDLLSDRVKRQRADICGKAIDVVDDPEAFSQILHGLAFNPWYCDLWPVQSAEIVQFVRRWGNRKGEEATPVVRALFSLAVASAKRHDDSWFTLASDELSVPESVLRSHAADGDSLSLAILIHIIRQQFIHIGTTSWPAWGIEDVLRAASEFNVQNTSPELQHEFCALWNQIIRKARNDYDYRIASHIFDPLRSVYISLHKGTDSAPTNFPAPISDASSLLDMPSLSSYPMCNVPDHILDDTAPTTFPRTVQLHEDVLTVASLTSPDGPSLSVPTPPHIEENLATAPSLDSSQCSHPTHPSVDSLSLSLTSPDPANFGAIQNIVAPNVTTPHPAPETSTPAPRSPTSPPTAMSLLDTVSPLTPSGSPNLPSPDSSDPFLDNIIPTESHRSIIVASAPSVSLVLTSSWPDPGTAVEPDGTPTPGLRDEKDALDLPSEPHGIDANIICTPDPPPQSPSLPLVTDSEVAVAGHSFRELSAGDNPPGPSRYQYDIV